MTRLVFIFFISLSVLNGLAQGCSDAGVCTAGSLDLSIQDSSSTSIQFGQTIEMGEKFTLITSTRLQIRFRLTPTTYISLSNNYFFASGNLGQTYGPGDFVGTFTQQIVRDKNYKFYINVGGKAPTNSSDFTNSSGMPLPMPYQSSLGTYDLLGGISLYFKKWHFSTGYQHAFNTNENEFLHRTWKNDETAIAYFESNKFKRGDDVMVRVERIFLKNNSTFSISVLPIYRIWKDEILKNGEYVQLDGSNQLTVNLNFAWNKKLNDKLSTRFTYGSPIWWRETRADGLTRFFVFYGGINYKI
ncbi:MAG: hypothetical protein JKY42_07760 [Flavobacteriales bacterium]|nr:hypothetical protein [Flavobacteriales bacterium]